MRDSIIYSTFRTFFVTIAWMAALAIGFVFLITLSVKAIDTKDTALEIHTTYAPRILANASGIRKSLSKDAPVILRLNINGVIGTKSFNRETINQLLIESRENSLVNDRVKAILLFIDSPGGTQTDSQGIYHLIQEYKERYRVPVYAYVDGLCASGGMYIACAADQIFASETSIIGSVGVIAPTFVNASQLMDKIGLTSLTLYEGKGKDDLNPLRPWKPEEGDNFKGIIDSLYQDFVNVVNKNRPKVDKKRLVEEYGAKIFVAPTAQALGFIDASGVSYNDALRTLAKKIGIDDDYYQVVSMHKETWIADLLQEQNSLLHKGELTHKLDLPMELDSSFNSQFLYMFRP